MMFEYLFGLPNLKEVFMPEHLLPIFCLIDDFCKLIDEKFSKKMIGNLNMRKNIKSCKKLSLSEIMTILIFFHKSNYRNFKSYYKDFVCIYWKELFPMLPSYQRFIERQQEAVMPMFLLFKCLEKKETGIYYIDSTPIKSCNILRANSHKVFKNLASKGKTSTGWFYGFKLHILINENGDLIDFSFTTGSIHDIHQLEYLSKSIYNSEIYGDKGYISTKIEKELKRKSTKLITKVRKNMKPRAITSSQKYFLSKRGLVETVIDILKNEIQIEHTRHRSINNFMANLFSGILAYNFRPKKPTVKKSLPILQKFGLSA